KSCGAPLTMTLKLFCASSALLTAWATSSSIFSCADFGSEGRCNRPFTQMPLVNPVPSRLSITSNGLKPTTSAEITSPVSVDKIGCLEDVADLLCVWQLLQSQLRFRFPA